MYTLDLLNLTRYIVPLFAPDDEGGSGGDTGDSSGAGGDADDANDQGGNNDVVLNGGTADGDVKPGGDDGDDDDDDTKSKALDSDDDSNDDGNDDDDDGNDDDDSGAPEEYDFTALMPEGVEIDESMVGAMAPVMKELNLSQADANKLVESYIKSTTEAAQQQANAVSDMLTGWYETAKADKEIGQGKWDESVEHANAFLKKFGTPELIEQVMKGQGMGNHPEMIRIFARAGKATADDQAPSGGNIDTSKDKSTEEMWYPTTPSTKKG